MIIIVSASLLPAKSPKESKYIVLIRPGITEVLKKIDSRTIVIKINIKKKDGERAKVVIRLPGRDVKITFEDGDSKRRVKTNTI